MGLTTEEAAAHKIVMETTLYGAPNATIGSSSRSYYETELRCVLLGIKWQKEKDRDFYIKYIKSEQEFQIPRMDKLGINTTGQIFEQMVTSLIHLGERSYSEEEVKLIINDIVEKHCTYFEQKIKDDIKLDWFEQFKKK